MTATQHDTRPDDPGRAAAIWVSGTGATLLLAAATLFVAVRWGDVPDEAKLGALSAITGGTLLAGHLLRDRLAATAGVLWHLGALLVPLNVVAVGVHLSWSFDEQLTFSGGIAAASWLVLSRRDGSPILSWASALVAPFALIGGAALVGTPPALVLAAGAAVALAVRSNRVAAGWAVVAGMIPVLPASWRALQASGLAIKSRAVDEVLELTATGPTLALVAGGALATAVLLVVARRRRDAVLLPVAGGIAMVTVLAGGQQIGLDGGGWAVLAATTFLGIELATASLRGDDLWARPAAVAALAAEAMAGLAIVVWPLSTHVVLAFSGLPTASSATILATAALAVAGWIAADMRRAETSSATPPWLLLAVGSGFWPTAPMVGLVTVSAIPMGLAPASAAAVVMAVIGLGVVFSSRRLAPLSALVVLLVAVSTAFDVPVVAASIGFAGSLALGWAVVLRARIGRADDETIAVGLTFGALTVALLGGLAVADGPGALAPALGAAFLAISSWSVAVLADRAPVGSSGLRLGLIGRAGSVAVAVVAALALEPTAGVVVASAVLLACVVDGALRRDVIVATGTAVIAPFAAMAGTAALGGDTAATALVLCTGSVVAVGVHLLVGDHWTLPAAGTAVSLGTVGLVLVAEPAAANAPDGPAVIGTALLLVAGAGLCESIVHRSWAGAGVAWIGVTLGAWMHLDAASVVALEAWVAPVATALLVAGIAARRTGVSSWLAYGPAIVLAGEAALLERVSGGAGYHAVIAGTVGVTAVAVGGLRRLGAPLILGTTLLVGTAVYESLGVTAGAPAWAWLALAGTVLVGVGIALERSQHGPIETGQRVLDTISHRFS
jgi:hypothetical protein